MGKWDNRKGFSMAELLVVAGVALIISAGIATILSTSLKVSQNIEQSSDFGNVISFITMALSNANPANPCSGMIALSTAGQTALNGVTTSKPALPTPAPGSPVGIAISQIANSGNVIADTNSPINNSVQLTAIGINLNSPVGIGLNGMPDGTTTYTAFLHLEGYKVNNSGTPQLTAPTLFRDIPLQMTISYNPATSTSAISSCSAVASGTESSGQTTCASLGGTWLSTLNPATQAAAPGRYMPPPGGRCNMVKGIDLSEVEWPYGVPNANPPAYNSSLAVNDPSTAAVLNGIAVNQCFHQIPGQSTVSTYNCLYLWGKQAGYRCVYDSSLKQWEVAYFNSSGLQTAVAYPCTQGVHVDVPSLTTVYLNYNQELQTAFADAPSTSQTEGSSFTDEPTREFNLDRLSTVTSCKYTFTTDAWTPCSNPTDGGLGASQGLGGSCIYVAGVRAAGYNATEFADMNAVAGGTGGCSGLSPDGCEIPTNYTGWIKVSSSYPRTYYKLAGPAPAAHEAWGLPCYQVQVNAANESTSGLGAVTTAPPTAAQDPSQVMQCLTTQPTWELVAGTGYQVSQVASTASPPKSPPSSRVLTLPCNNANVDVVSSMGLAGMVGAGSPASSLTAGSCWYFDSIAGTGIKTTYGLISGASAPGWYYLRQTLPVSLANSYPYFYQSGNVSGGSIIPYWNFPASAPSPSGEYIITVGGSPVLTMLGGAPTSGPGTVVVVPYHAGANGGPNYTLSATQCDIGVRIAQ